MYSFVKLQNAHFSTTRALPLELVVAAVITLLRRRLRAIGALRALFVLLTHFG